jgi:class 3 adenylate cyclase
MASTDLLTIPDVDAAIAGLTRRRFERAEPRSARRCHATLMFVDIRGSMALSGAVEPEDWWALLDDLFERMCDAVYALGGWVESFTGDGIAAVFESGAGGGDDDDDDDDHAIRACLAGVRVLSTVRAAAAALEDLTGHELAVRVGINSGDIMVGTIGDRYQRCHIASGYAMALAKRMETLAVPGRICISEHTAALVTDAFGVRDLGAFPIKGAPAPVGLFELGAAASDD